MSQYGYSDDAVILRHAGQITERYTTERFWGLIPDKDGAAQPYWSVDRLSQDPKDRLPVVPPQDQESVCRNLFELLNRKLHHDGRWGCVWTEWVAPTVEDMVEGRIQGYYYKFVALWFDRDGDLRFTMDTDDMTGEIIKMGGIDWYLEHAENATQHLIEHDRQLEIRPEDTIKAALGERSADPLAGAALIHDADDD